MNSEAYEDDGYLDALVASINNEEDGPPAGADVAPVVSIDTGKRVSEEEPKKVPFGYPSGKPSEKARPGRGDSWRPVDLAAVLSGEYEVPEPTVGAVDGAEQPLFYPGRINSVFGDSGSGKSWLLAFVISQVISDGRDAVVIDYEDTPSALAARLQQVGVDTDDILAHLIYISPQERWDGRAAGHLANGLSGRDVALAVIDSTGEGMAQDGVNPNSDDEVARWFQGAARTLAGFGASVVLIDHVVKSRESARGVEFASGSHRKRAAINGAAYFLEAIVSPSRETDGLLKLVVRKDRFGWRKHGATAAEIRMVNQEDGNVTMTLVAPVGNTGGAWKPDLLMGRVCDVLRETAEPMSRAAIKRSVTGKGQYIDVAIDHLLAGGNVTEKAGLRKSKLVELVRHIDDDDAAADPAPF
jgi:hypothetical protein